MELTEMLAEAFGQDGPCGDPNCTACAPARCPLTGADAAAALIAASVAWNTIHAFKPGDLVRQKDGLASGIMPGKKGDNPAVFMEYRDGLDALFEPMGNGEPFGRLARDCLIGWLAADGAVVISACNSQNFEPLPDPEFAEVDAPTVN